MKRGGIRTYTSFVVSTFLPDKKRVHRKQYKPCNGGLLTEHIFPIYLEEHRRTLAPFGVQFREVRTGANSYNFIHPDLDKKGEHATHA
jgi:hypothetical protein